MRRMSEAYEQLLGAVIQRLEQMKADGVRYVPVSPERLAELSTEQRRGFGKSTPTRVRSTPAQAPSSSRSNPPPAKPSAPPLATTSEVPRLTEPASGSGKGELTPE